MTGDLPFFRNALLVLIILPLGHVWGPFKASSFFFSEINCISFHLEKIPYHLLGKAVTPVAVCGKIAYLPLQNCPHKRKLRQMREGLSVAGLKRRGQPHGWSFALSLVSVVLPLLCLLWVFCRADKVTASALACQHKALPLLQCFSEQIIPIKSSNNCVGLSFLPRIYSANWFPVLSPYRCCLALSNSLTSGIRKSN